MGGVRRRPARLLLALTAVVVLAAAVFLWWPIVPKGRPTAPVALVDGPPLAESEEIIRFASDTARGIDALVIVDAEGTRLSFGPVDRPMNTGSARKSILSLLVGIAEARGVLDLETTLAELELDESATPLTTVERQATLQYLIMGRSGIYLPSGGETDLIRATRPARGSAQPGEQFFYNNWDFNMLGIAFEQATGLEIGQAMEDWLAVPLGLQDFDPAHVYFDPSGSGSDYPTYRMFLSARDMARIGLMVTQDGHWQGQEVVPAEWLDLALRPWSEVGPPLSRPPIDGFGYSWWVNTDTGDVVAAGWGGQFLYVERANGRATVLRRDTGQTLAGHLWFRQFGTPGRAEDLLHILALAQAG